MKATLDDTSSFSITFDMSQYRRRGKKPSFSGPPSDEVNLQRNLRAWGVDPDQNDNHRDFWNDCTEYLRNVLDGKFDMEPSNCLQLLSPDVVVAVEEVMKQELTSIYRKGDCMIDVVDRWKENYPNLGLVGPPFEFDRQERKYRLKTQVQAVGIQVNNSDPFQRYTYDLVDSKQLLRKQNVDEEGHLNIFYRAIVAHQACLDARCVNCFSDESIRWNGYEEATDTQQDCQFRYWKKLVCINCQSVYEIKTAANLKQIEKKLNGGIVNGGNFYSSYHAIQNVLLTQYQAGPTGGAPRPRQYVAVLSRETTTGGNANKRVWPVHVAEVKSVGPQFKSRSFCRDATCSASVKIYSCMYLDKGAGRFWFNAPHVEMYTKPMAAAIVEDLP